MLDSALLPILLFLLFRAIISNSQLRPTEQVLNTLLAGSLPKQIKKTSLNPFLKNLQLKMN